MRETENETLRDDEQPMNLENVQQIGETVRPSNSKTYEELFMENVQNLGPCSERAKRDPSRFREDACSVIDSLISENDQLAEAHHALSSKYADQWKDAMIITIRETRELVPPTESKNVVGSLLWDFNEAFFASCATHY